MGPPSVQALKYYVRCDSQPPASEAHVISPLLCPALDLCSALGPLLCSTLDLAHHLRLVPRDLCSTGSPGDSSEYPGGF